MEKITAHFENEEECDKFLNHFFPKRIAQETPGVYECNGTRIRVYLDVVTIYLP